MTPQTQDNLRCLAAVVFILGLSFAAYLVQGAWFPSALWLPAVAFVASLPVALHLFNRNHTDQVSFDDAVVTRTLPDGTTEAVRWDELQEVVLVTSDGGPGGEDVYWMLVGTDGGCAVSGGAQGVPALLSRLQRLPGFDDGEVIKAVGCTSDARFVCWRRESSNPT